MLGLLVLQLVHAVLEEQGVPCSAGAGGAGASCAGGNSAIATGASCTDVATSTGSCVSGSSASSGNISVSKPPRSGIDSSTATMEGCHH